MGRITRCPLNGLSCNKPITMEEKSFFLAEAEKPENDKKWRREALATVLEKEYKYKIRSALDESDVNTFTCKICGMIQTCAYGIADITSNNPNVLLELGMMVALDKPTIILTRKDQEQELSLPSDIIDREVIPFTDYTEIMPKLRKMVENLPLPISPPNPIEDLEKIQPRFADDLRKIGANIVKDFKESIEEAKLDTISPTKEKKEIPPELSERLRGLEEKLEEMRGLGFITDARTAFLRGNYFYDQAKYEEALVSYNWYLELKPDDPVALYNRGITYAKLGRYDEAFADFNHSLKLNPNDPLAFYNRGTTYAKLGRYDEAFADFNHSLKLNPNDPLALCNRGITYTKLGKYDEALADFNLCLELEPDDPDTLYNLACLFSLWRKPDESLNYLEKAIDKDKKYREMAKTDKDFDNIRKDPRFKKLIE